MSDLTHFNAKGEAHMVDVSEKNVTAREALAQAEIELNEAAFDAVRSGESRKGDVLAVARIAGIQGAKRTSELIPLCHPLMISKVSIDFELDETKRSVKIFARVKTSGQTGVEMEALTAASIASLTIYDMLKAVDKTMVIGQIHLVEKKGGRSGDFRFDDGR